MLRPLEHLPTGQGEAAHLWIAATGVLLWGIALLALRPEWEMELLLLAALGTVPLCLRVACQIAPLDDLRFFRLARWLQLPAGLLLLAAFAFPRAATSAALAVPWFSVTVLLCLTGMQVVGGWIRTEAKFTSHEFWGPLRSTPGTLPTLCIAAGLMFSVIGGAFAVITRSGWRPLGFEDVIIRMTAVHFHYAGLVLPILSARAAAELGTGRVQGVALTSVIVATPLLATGITLSPPLEILAAAALVFACMVVGDMQLRLAARANQPLPLLLYGISGVSLLAAMPLALIYAASEWYGTRWITIPTMIQVHGTLNALGFALCGTLGWLVRR